MEVELGRDIRISKPRLPFQTKLDNPVTGAAGYHVVSNGQRFIVNEPAALSQVRELHVVENWDKLVLGR